MSHQKLLLKYSKDSSNTVCVETFETPVGKCIAAADDEFLLFLTFEDSQIFERVLESISEEISCKFVEKRNKVLQMLEDELSQYFEGKLKKFTVSIKTFGSSFQKEVWGKLQELPYGSTLTYGDLAKALGRPASHARAVGAACGANAHLLVVPCHRLVASGSKGGFNSGVDRKQFLLNHEMKYAT